MVGLLLSIVLSLLLIDWARADTISEMLKLVPGLPHVRNEVHPINPKEGVYIIDYAQVNYPLAWHIANTPKRVPT